MMPSLATSRAHDLRETNRRLLGWLDRMSAEWEPACLATTEDIAALLAELMRTGAELRPQRIPNPGADPEFDRELEHYRGLVERLRELLPSIHGQLMAERARLEAQRARMSSAAEWARTSRQTL